MRRGPDALGARRRPTAPTTSAASAIVTIVTVAAVVAALLAGCSGRIRAPGPDEEATLPPSIAEVERVVALGDSVTTGSTCRCVAFPALVGQGLTAATGHQVTVTDDGVDGADTAFVLSRLRDDAQVRADVGAADVVLLTIGANDLTPLTARAPGRGTPPCVKSCYAPAARKAAAAVATVVGVVHSLAPDARIVVTDYWNVFTDGTSIAPQVRAYNGAVTRAFDDALHAAVSPTGATYVDLVGPFAAAGDPTPLLLADGDHPSAAGHRVIAETTLRAVGVPAGVLPSEVTPGTPP